MSFVLTDGPVMSYAWGSKTLLAQYLGTSASGGPEAELWMGSHPKGPARLVDATDARDLKELLALRGRELLGDAVFEEFGDLPFLLKILAIGAPLSLQAHPDAEQARAGFEREEALGIPIDSPLRNYRDRRHKPELLMALSPVQALCGFRSPDQILRMFGELGLDHAEGPLHSALESLRGTRDSAGLERLLRTLLALDSGEVGDCVEVLVKSAPRLSGASPEIAASLSWVEPLFQRYGPDPGVLASLVLRHVRLSPGEALYLGPRRLHAYLSGLGVELMASSDNVLRGGLTEKHVDAEELCRVLDFSPSDPRIIVPKLERPASPGVRLQEWDTPAREFRLLRYEMLGGEVQLPSPSLVIVTEGHIGLSATGRRTLVERGGQAFCGADGPCHASGTGQFYCATLPVR